MKDAIGHIHEPAHGEIRIVSLVPSLTELLFELGLGDQIVGRTTFCIHPKAVAEIPRVGGTKHVKLDKLAALRPTHVLVNIDENRKEDVDKMREFVPNIIVTHPQHPLDNLTLFSLLGFVFSTLSKASELSQSFQRHYEHLLQLRQSLPERQVLYLIWVDPWMSVAKTTYIGQMLALIGWKLPFDEMQGRYPEVSPETVASTAFDWVLFSSEPYPFKAKHREQFCHAFRYPLEKTLTIDGEMTSWYGSRSILGLSYLAQIARDAT